MTKSAPVLPADNTISEVLFFTLSIDIHILVVFPFAAEKEHFFYNFSEIFHKYFYQFFYFLKSSQFGFITKQFKKYIFVFL